MRNVYVLLALAAGVAAACQGAANSGLASRLTLGTALLINSIIVLAATIVLYVAQGPRSDWFPHGTPWTLYLGGLFGFVIIACLAFVFPRIGGGLAIAAMVLGQGLAALVIDYFGLFGMPRQPVATPQMLGVVLLAGGVWLMRR